MGRALATLGVDDRDLARTRQRQTATALVDDRLHVAIFDRAVGDGFEVRLLVDLRRAADVEGPHRQLGAGLADRLGGDDTDRFADVHRRTARQVAAIAFGADAQRRFADQRAADLDRLHFGVLDLRDHRFVEQRAHRSDDIAVLVGDVLERRAAEDTLAERGDRRTALDDRAHFHAAFG